MAGIPTSNILQPGNISLVGGVTRQLVSDLQLLTPQYYKNYVEKYGSEDFTWWLATYGGMEEVKNREFFWFENRGKLITGVQTVGNVVAGVGANVTLTLASGFHYNSGTQSPLRVGETVRVASTNVEGIILGVSSAVPGAFTFVVAPKITTQSLASAGSGSFLSTDALIFGGIMDAGEASQTNAPTQAGTSLFTLKGLVKSNVRFKDDVEMKLMRGNQVNNTAALTGTTYATSVGSEGIIPKVLADGETVGYTPGNLDIAKIHEITRIMDVNGCASENMWLQDIYQNQNFSDGLFAAYPAGAWVWGANEKSEEAAINYGCKSISIDGYLFKVKKYRPFNSEFLTGVTPNTDFFRNFGMICPQGETRDSKDASKLYKNITIMYQQPPKGGTVGNGIRVWQWGGGSQNPTSGTMNDNVEMITYRGSRVAAANQFVIVQGS